MAAENNEIVKVAKLTTAYKADETSERPKVYRLLPQDRPASPGLAKKTRRPRKLILLPKSLITPPAQPPTPAPAPEAPKDQDLEAERHERRKKCAAVITRLTCLVGCLVCMAIFVVLLLAFAIFSVAIFMYNGRPLIENWDFLTAIEEYEEEQAGSPNGF